MENTIHLMNSRNESYRKGLSRVEKSSKLYGWWFSLLTSGFCVRARCRNSLSGGSVYYIFTASSLEMFYIFDLAVLMQDLNFLLVRIWLTHTLSCIALWIQAYCKYCCTKLSQITVVFETLMFELHVYTCNLYCKCCIGEELTQLELLEGQWRAALDKLKHKKKQTRQLEEDLQV